ncbi:hypothetical protein B0H14DRAFT_2630212 [Mycena olivaceomarginata]|nr:hypothetical protein B0H14DRAFT_2630212 [Mycena olivaceomarginata]
MRGGGGPECPGSAQQQRAAGGCAPHEGAPCRGGPARTGSAQQLRRPHCAVGAGQRALGRRTTATGGVSVHGAGGASRRNDSGPGVGAARRALVRNARRGRGSAHWVGATGTGGARVRSAWGAYRGRCWSPGIRLAQGAAEQNRQREPGQRAAGRDSERAHGGAGGG